MGEFMALREALIAGDGDQLLDETRRVLDSGISADRILHEALIGGMEIVGDKFNNDELYIPEVINIATIFKQAVGLLTPHIVDTAAVSAGKVLVGTVEGDLHDIGKNIVMLMLEANGFEVIDLGVDVASADFVAKAQEHDVDVIGMSALLTTTMANITLVAELLRGGRLSGRFKTIIGGAPINQSFADQAGVDAYGHDAIDAVQKIKGLLA